MNLLSSLSQPLLMEGASQMLCILEKRRRPHTIESFGMRAISSFPLTSPTPFQTFAPTKTAPAAILLTITSSTVVISESSIKSFSTVTLFERV